MSLLHIQPNYSSVESIHKNGEITLGSGPFHYVLSTKNIIARRRHSDFGIGLYCSDASVMARQLILTMWYRSHIEIL